MSESEEATEDSKEMEKLGGSDERSPRDRVKDGIVAIGNKTTDTFKRASKSVQDIGGSIIGSRAAMGFVESYFSRKLGEIRPDQTRALLDEGRLLSDMINRDHDIIRRTVPILNKFMSREKMIKVLEESVTPQLVAKALKEANPEVYKIVVEHSGEKWFVDQTREVKKELKRILKE